MEQRKSAADARDTAPATPPRHALEAADAGGLRSTSALRRVALRIAAALTRDLALGSVQLAAAEGGRFDALSALLDEAHNLAAISIEPVHAPALFAVPAALTSWLVERRYGGTKIAAGAPRPGQSGGVAADREFAGLAETMAAALREGCEDRVPVTATRLGSLDTTAANELFSAGEAMGRITLDWHVPGAGEPQPLLLFLPLAALRAATVLQVALNEREVAQQRRWRARLGARLGDVAMPARSVIARPTLSMAQLMALRTGDVIPIAMPRVVPLLVADRKVASGTIGERDGRVAFLIDQLEQEMRA